MKVSEQTVRLNWVQLKPNKEFQPLKNTIAVYFGFLKGEEAEQKKAHSRCSNDVLLYFLFSFKKRTLMFKDISVCKSWNIMHFYKDDNSGDVQYTLAEAHATCNTGGRVKHLFKLGVISVYYTPPIVSTLCGTKKDYEILLLPLCMVLKFLQMCHKATLVLFPHCPLLPAIALSKGQPSVLKSANSSISTGCVCVQSVGFLFILFFLQCSSSVSVHSSPRSFSGHRYGRGCMETRGDTHCYLGLVSI